MDPITAPLAFLARDPLYITEKPYIVVHAKGSSVLPDGAHQKLDNLKFAQIPVPIHDVRKRSDVTLSRNGFQTFSHTFNDLLLDEESVLAYRRETEEILKTVLDAEDVLCYDFRYRRNVPLKTLELDVNDPLLVEGPPTGAHDLTFGRAPKILRTLLKEHGRSQFLKPGSRIRIVKCVMHRNICGNPVNADLNKSTWRPIVPVLEDRPLAFCDFSSLDPKDMVPTDRIYPHRVTELYYLHQNDAQDWYWFSNQTPKETLMMLMYGTHPNGGAKYCPHVSFPNPKARPLAPPRESVETRSIVITKARV